MIFTVYVYDKVTGKQVDEYDMQAESRKEAEEFADDSRFNIVIY